MLSGYIWKAFIPIIVIGTNGILKLMGLKTGKRLTSSCRFGGRQLAAFEDNGLVNYAAVRDAAEDEARLEQFGAELEAPWAGESPIIAVLSISYGPLHVE